MHETPEVRRLAALASTGLISPEEPVALLTDEPKIPGYVCLPSRAAQERFHTAKVHGQGFHPDDALARLKSAAECLERLSIYNPQPDRFVRGAYTPDSGWCDPALFRSLSSEQVRDLPTYTSEIRSSTYRWWNVREYTSRTDTAIPAQTVFISSVFDDEFEVRKEQITTGAALGRCGTGEAFENGLLEAVERDACIAAYLQKAEIPRIVDLPPDLQKLVQYLDRYRLEPHIFDATSDLGIPTVLVITLDRTGIGPAVTAGSCSSWCYERAIESALLESVQCRRSGRLMRENLFPNGLPTEHAVTSLDDRFYFWHSIERIRDLAFWLENPRYVAFGERARCVVDVEEVLRRIAAKSYHVFVADMTLPAIREAGFEALKVVIPEFHPLYLDENAKALYSVHHGEIRNDPALKPHPLT